MLPWGWHLTVPILQHLVCCSAKTKAGPFQSKMLKAGQEPPTGALLYFGLCCSVSALLWAHSSFSYRHIPLLQPHRVLPQSLFHPSCYLMSSSSVWQKCLPGHHMLYHLCWMVDQRDMPSVLETSVHSCVCPAGTIAQKENHHWCYLAEDTLLR